MSYWHYVRNWHRPKQATAEEEIKRFLDPQGKLPEEYVEAAMLQLTILGFDEKSIRDAISLFSQ